MAADDHAIIASDWYAERIGAGLRGTTEALAGARPRWLTALAERVPPLRGALLYSLAGRSRGIAIINREPGMATLLFLEAWVRRRRAVVVLELIPRRPGRRFRGLVYRAWAAVILDPAVRRAMAAAQVPTEAERDRYAAALGIPVERLRFIPWARSAGESATGDRERVGVLASGRAWCDWETLFEAARGSGWRLTVVSAKADRRRVERLNHDGTAHVLSEIALDRHEVLMRETSVYVIALRPDAPSAGQVRLMAATDAGTPVVASEVEALAAYAEDGVSARLVPPGDPAALREAVDGLLESPRERERLVAGASERAREWTYREYFAAIDDLIRDAL